MPKTRQRRSLNERIRNAGLTSWALIGVAILIYGFFKFLIAPLAVVFGPVAIGVVIVYLLNPLVNVLVQRGLRRGISVLIVWLLFLAIVTTALAFLIPFASGEISTFIDNVPQYVEKATTEINEFAEKRNLNFRVTLTRDQVVEFIQEHRETFISFLGGIGSFAGRLVHVIITLVIGLVLSIYLLLDLPKMRTGFMKIIPEDYRDEVIDVGQRIGTTLGGFFRGQLFVAIFVGVASAIGLTLVKLPFAVVVGIIAGIFNLVPLIGPFIGAIPAVLLGLLSGKPITALWAVLVLLVVQQIDNHIISPNVMGRTVKLHPITVMLALLVGGSFAGIFGMLLIIPIVATVKIVAGHLWAKREELGVPEGIAEAGT